MDALNIVFRHMDPSPAVEARIRTHVERLAQVHGRITTGQVVVEAPHRHNRQGRLFTVRLRLSTPGRQVVVAHEGRLDHAHEDIYVALRDAFEAAARQLETHGERMRGDIKTHAAAQRGGRVARLFDDHGFVVDEDGQEIYFHAHSVTGNRFGSLSTGNAVRLVVAEGESAHGPQASTVIPRHRRRKSDPDTQSHPNPAAGGRK